MSKKFISLGMSFLLLFKVSTSTVFALDNEETYQNIDYCRGYPKNIYGNTVNVECAISNVLPDFKRNKEKTSISLKNLGEKGSETDVLMWKYKGLKDFTRAVCTYLENADNENAKEKFAEEISKFFNLSSTKDALKVINGLPTFPEECQKDIQDEDLLKWLRKQEAKRKEKRKKYERIVSGDIKETLSFGALGGAVGATLGESIREFINYLKVNISAGKDKSVETELSKEKVIVKNEFKEKEAEARPSKLEVLTKLAKTWSTFLPGLISAMALGTAGAYWGWRSSKGQKISEKIYEDQKIARKHKKKLEIYSWGLEHILDSIKKEEWIDNDLLRVELIYGGKSPMAYVYFVNENIGDPNNATAIFKNLSEKLYSQKIFKISYI